MRYIVEYTTLTGRRIPVAHKIFETRDAAEAYGKAGIAASNYKSYTVVDEGYKILPAIDRDRYGEREGLEGPFRTLSGKVVYYDPQEGEYYDPDTDMYLSYDEFRELDNDYSDMKDERDIPVREGKNAADYRQGLVDKIKKSGVVKSGSMSKDPKKGQNRVKGLNRAADKMDESAQGNLKEAEIELEKGYTIHTDRPQDFVGTKTAGGDYVGGAAGEDRYIVDQAMKKIEYNDPTDSNINQIIDRVCDELNCSPRQKRMIAKIWQKIGYDVRIDEAKDDISKMNDRDLGAMIDKLKRQRNRIQNPKAKEKIRIDIEKYEDEEKRRIRKNLDLDEAETELDEIKGVFKNLKKHAANLGDKFVQGALHGATFGQLGHDTWDPLTGDTYDKVKPFSNRLKKNKKTNEESAITEGDIVNFSMYAGMYSDGARASFIGRDGDMHTISATGDRPRKYYIDGKEVSWEDAKRIVGNQKLQPRQGMAKSVNEGLGEAIEVKSGRNKGKWRHSYSKSGEVWDTEAAADAAYKKQVEKNKNTKVKLKDLEPRKSVSEGLSDDAHYMERDHEVQMARSDLYKTANYAVKLHSILKGISEEQGLEGWMQAKITKAADYLGSVFHALEYDQMERRQGNLTMPVGEAKVNEGIENLSNARLKYHATKGVPHGRYSSKEIKDEHNRRKKSEPNYHTVKPSMNETTSAGGVAAVARPFGKTVKRKATK